MCNRLICGAVVFIVIATGVPACDQGLEPEPPPQYGITGKIFFRNWPPPDSVGELAVAALKDYPQQNPIAEILNGIITGRAVYDFPQYSYGDSVGKYQLLISPLSPGSVAYVAVGRLIGSDFTNPSHWRIAGVYYAPGDTSRPGTVFVPGDQIVQGVDITVDFLNPPPQP